MTIETMICILLICAGQLFNQRYQRKVNVMFSKDIILLRGLLSDHLAKINDLRRRVWALETHTPQETMEELAKEIDEFEKLSKKLLDKFGK